jgi:hypothetical protein
VNSHIWLGGDFNLGGINWENGSIRPKASNTKQCKQLLDISHNHALEQMVRNRPFNLQGGLFRSEFFFRTTRDKIKKNCYMIKTESDYIFFFLHRNQNMFFSNIGNQNIFLEKTIPPPSS